MRLTNTIRDSFIRAAMQDVPALTNYEDEAHKLLVDDSIEQLPAKLRPLAKDKETSKFLYMKSHYYYNSPFSSVYVFAVRNGGYEPSKPVAAKVLALSDKAKQEKSMRNELEEKLRGVAYGCTTRKALAAALPEFEKYLPADEPAACRSLPAVANLVAEFTKAGWPKNKPTK